MRRALLGVFVIFLIFAAWSARSSLYYLAGIYALRSSCYDSALSLFSRTLHLDPEYTAAYDARGRVHLLLGRTRLAQSDFNSALELDPGYAPAYCHRGVAFLRSGNSAQGERDLKKALDFDPAFFEAFYALGVLYDEKELYELSLHYFSMALEAAPSSGQTLFRRAQLKHKLGDYGRRA